MMTLEFNPAGTDKTPEAKVGHRVLLMTPPVGEDYWLFRVKLSDTQSIIGFPKFGTIGIGFAKETDWNTNLPYTSSAHDIFEHIRHNKGDDSISDSDCIAAIELIREAALLSFAGEAQ